MSEPTPEPTPTPNPAPEPTPTPPAQGTDWKAEARKWEERAKGNKSELDELTGKFTALSTERDGLFTKVETYEAEKTWAQIVSDVAKELKVPASALRGNTREEIEAHGKELLELIKPAGPVVPGQERTPQHIPDSPEREFVGNLFKSE